ncbi:hypothetical protein CC78DRAFT_61970 [Lojkania enalia]|uniref:Secreted protein n=1 Tax=Lojkania enalia TaxID=147567 RepID=A0A9P4KG97_9PLEO|nr:hypothetical protein CC78DRAFT_61970 [Didymosphaeria enalia]
MYFHPYFHLFLIFISLSYGVVDRCCGWDQVDSCCGTQDCDLFCCGCKISMLTYNLTPYTRLLSRLPGQLPGTMSPSLPKRLSATTERSAQLAPRPSRMLPVLPRKLHRGTRASQAERNVADEVDV